MCVRVYVCVDHPPSRVRDLSHAGPVHDASHARLFYLLMKSKREIKFKKKRDQGKHFIGVYVIVIVSYLVQV